jgi:hypothetical protein
MNYQGTGAAQWIVGLPLMFLPILIYWLLDFFIGFKAALIGLSSLGIIGLVLRPRLMEYIAGVYRKRKYAMINGFKQTGE